MSEPLITIRMQIAEPQPVRMAIGEDPAPVTFTISEDDMQIAMEMGEGTIISDIYPDYEGETTVRPRIGEAQILDTSLTVLHQDVTVEQIPVVTTSNIYGGKTVVIG